MLTLITAPTEYPVTLTEVKAHLAIDVATEDTRLSTLIAAATILSEIYTGRAFCEQTWKLTKPSFSEIDKLPKAPLIEIEKIEYYDTDNTLQTWDSDNYLVFAPSNAQGWIQPDGYTYPCAYTRDDAVQITFTCGYPASSGSSTIPPQAVMAILFIIACWNENRGDNGSLTDIPQGARALLDQLVTGEYR